MYEQHLKELGLTENEIKVYLVLIESGSLNPTTISQKTGLHRSYIYDTLDRLLERGIVNTVLIDNKKNYQAVDPRVLREIYELKLRQLDNLIPKLSDLYNSTKGETRVELHRGKRVFRTLIKHLISNTDKNDTVYLLGADETMLETVEPIYLKQYFNIIREKNVKEKIIIAKGGKRFPQKNLEYRELDPKYFDETTIVMIKSKVFIFIWGNPYHLIIIESQRVCDTYKKQFTLLWDIAK